MTAGEGPSFTELEERAASIRGELARIGRPDARIVAVTKGFGVDAWRAARRAGFEIVGESYAQELLAKYDSWAEAEVAADAALDVHFIGRIQRNKVRKIAGAVDLWHSVARLEILQEIGRRRPDAEVLLQVDVADDPTKAGIDVASVEEMLSAAEAAGVRVAGLMTIGVHGDPAASNEAFLGLARLAEEHGLRERSMGMSGDWRDAAAAGATLLRLGSVLFGPRPR